MYADSRRGDHQTAAYTQGGSRSSGISRSSGRWADYAVSANEDYALRRGEQTESSKADRDWKGPRAGKSGEQQPNPDDVAMLGRRGRSDETQLNHKKVDYGHNWHNGYADTRFYGGAASSSWKGKSGGGSYSNDSVPLSWKGQGYQSNFRDHSSMYGKGYYGKAWQNSLAKETDAPDNAPQTEVRRGNRFRKAERAPDAIVDQAEKGGDRPSGKGEGDVSHQRGDGDSTDAPMAGGGDSNHRGKDGPSSVSSQKGSKFQTSASETANHGKSDHNEKGYSLNPVASSKWSDAVDFPEISSFGQGGATSNDYLFQDGAAVGRKGKGKNSAFTGYQSGKGGERTGSASDQNHVAPPPPPPNWRGLWEDPVSKSKGSGKHYDIGKGKPNGNTVHDHLELVKGIGVDVSLLGDPESLRSLNQVGKPSFPESGMGNLSRHSHLGIAEKGKGKASFNIVGNVISSVEAGNGRIDGMGVRNQNHLFNIAATEPCKGNATDLELSRNLHNLLNTLPAESGNGKGIEMSRRDHFSAPGKPLPLFSVDPSGRPGVAQQPVGPVSSSSSVGGRKGKGFSTSHSSDFAMPGAQHIGAPSNRFATKDDSFHGATVAGKGFSSMNSVPGNGLDAFSQHASVITSTTPQVASSVQAPVMAKGSMMRQMTPERPRFSGLSNHSGMTGADSQGDRAYLSTPPAEIVALWGSQSPDMLQSPVRQPSDPGIRTPSDDGQHYDGYAMHGAERRNWQVAAGLDMQQPKMMSEDYSMSFNASAGHSIWTPLTENPGIWHPSEMELPDNTPAGVHQDVISGHQPWMTDVQREKILSAQEEAESAWRWENIAQSGLDSYNCGLQAADFLGSWIDSKGNSVVVTATDAWQMELTVILSRPPRPDVFLRIEHSAEHGTWHCGNSTLDSEMSCSARVQWVRNDGHVSIWNRGRQV